MALPLKTVVRGFLLAPLLPIALIFGIGGIIDAVTVQSWSLEEIVGHALFVFVYLTIAAYIFMTFFVVPLYLLGWMYFRVNLLACVVCGAVIGGAFLLIPFLLQYYGHAPMFDSESLGGTTLVMNRKFTAAGIENRLTGVVEGALFGAAIAFVFWAIAVRDNPAAQSRHGEMPHG
jgi:hypothetical protein